MDGGEITGKTHKADKAGTAGIPGGLQPTGDFALSCNLHQNNTGPMNDKCNI
jgi:hypothetical protein